MRCLNSQLQAWITIDDIELTEYRVEISAEENKATCWIPAQEGKVRDETER